MATTSTAHSTTRTRRRKKWSESGGPPPGGPRRARGARLPKGEPRRAQARRAEGRAAPRLLRAFEDLARHRGCAPSRLGAALAQELAAQLGGGGAAAPDESNWKTPSAECAANVRGATQEHHQGATASAVGADQKPIVERDGNLLAARAAVVAATVPSLVSTQTAPVLQATAEKADSSTRRLAVEAAVRAALAQRAREGEHRPPSPSADASMADGDDPAASFRGGRRKNYEPKEGGSQSRLTRAFGFGNGRK